MSRFRPSILTALSVLAAAPASAVIVGGANGDGPGNATESGLQAHLAAQALPVFPFWNNLLRVSDSSGVYLGRNADTGRGWVMTATHVTQLSVGSGTITVAGQTYIVRDSRIIKHPDSNASLNSDIRLYAIGGDMGDPALPALPAVPILASDVTEGDHLVLTGRGRRQQVPTEDTTEPYAWDSDTSPANQLTRQMRWGSNHVGIFTDAAPELVFSVEEGSPTITKETLCFASVFDDPAGDGTAFEGQLALLDSGGGAFVRRGACWYLAGINSYVDDGPDADNTADPAGYGDFSIMPHLPSYREQITSLTGALGPARTGPLEDLDGDGITNLMEYALNLNPLVNEQVPMEAGTGLRGLPLIRVENISGSDRLTIEFVRRTNSGLNYSPRFSNDLQTWLATGTETVAPINADWDRVKLVDSQDISASPERFARLQVED